MLEASLAECFEEASTASFGKIVVTLGRRRTAETRCAEVLQVVVGDQFSDHDMTEYIRFHNAYVLHRVRKGWPHTFAMVYDVSGVAEPASWPAFVERALSFSMMHAALGTHYLRHLHRVVAIVNDRRYVPLILRVQAPFVDSSTPSIVFRTHEDGGTLAEEIRRDATSETGAPPEK